MAAPRSPDRPDLLEATRRIAAICRALPEAYQEAAWIGTRWAVRKRTFAHLAEIAGGHPPVYARALASAGIDRGVEVADHSALVLTFESEGAELAALRNSEPPFFAPPWRPTIVGLVIDGSVDDDELTELITESYLVRAPVSLARLVDASR